ncbi:MAG TPA: hemerythrin domain-containing protein [Polyangiaceae bacterium]
MASSIDSALAKMAGTAGFVEARLRGLRGVFTTLAEQHHELGALLGRLEEAKEPEKRKELWTEIRRELVSHEQAELIEIYPLLEAHERTRAIAREHIEDADELELQVRELDRSELESEEWTAALGRLISKFDEHVKLEEEHLFLEVQEALGEQAAKELEEPFLRTKELALGALR